MILVETLTRFKNLSFPPPIRKVITATNYSEVITIKEYLRIIFLSHAIAQEKLPHFNQWQVYPYCHQWIHLNILNFKETILVIKKIQKFI